MTIPILKPQDRDEVRRLAALKMLWQLLAVARERDFLGWRRAGGPEAAALLHALGSGGDHPTIRRHGELKAKKGAHHPAPDPMDMEARRLTLLMIEALRRVGVGEGMARARAAKAVNQIFPTTTAAIKGWRRGYRTITEADEKIIAAVVKDYGHDHRQIIDWFVGNILFQIDPIASQNAQLLPPRT